MKYAAWLLDSGTEHERAIAGSGYAPSMGGITAEPLVLLSDALVEIERLSAGVKIRIPTDTMEQEIAAHVRRAVTAERERCAKLCERQDWPGDSETDYLAGIEFAARIRRLWR